MLCVRITKRDYAGSNSTKRSRRDERQRGQKASKENARSSGRCAYTRYTALYSLYTGGHVMEATLRIVRSSSLSDSPDSFSLSLSHCSQCGYRLCRAFVKAHLSGCSMTNWPGFNASRPNKARVNKVNKALYITVVYLYLYLYPLPTPNLSG